MQTTTARTLIASAVIDRACLYRDRSGKDRSGKGWEIWLYGDHMPTGEKQWIEAKRGGRRQWASLERAYAYLADLMDGRKFPVEIDG